VTPIFDRAGRSWLESWVDMTTWWIEPTRRASEQALPYGPERMLVEVVDGLAQRFGGGPVECSVRGRSVVAHLDWLRLVRREGRYEAHLQLSHAALDGFPMDRLSAVAQSLQITSGRQPRLTLRDIEVNGRSALSAVVGWLSTRLNEWFFSIDDAGAIIARHRRRSVALEVEPSVDHDRLQLELRALRWRHRRVPVPAWLRLKRTVILHLQPGVSVVQARRRDQEVDFELRVESVDQGFKLAQLRDAILRGARVLLP
jgi:hypothetical protein